MISHHKGHLRVAFLMALIQPLELIMCNASQGYDNPSDFRKWWDEQIPTTGAN